MQPNVGNTDAAIRWFGAAVLFLASIMLNPLLWSFLVVLVAVVMAATALTRRCPLYVLLGIDSHARPGSSLTSEHPTSAKGL